MKTGITLLLAVVLLTGCGMASDLADSNLKMEKVNKGISNELGFDVQVGWNIYNGTLTQVTLLLPSDKVEGMTFSQIKQRTYPLVKKHFEQEPKMYQLVTVYPISGDHDEG